MHGNTWILEQLRVVLPMLVGTFRAQTHANLQIFAENVYAM